MPGLRTRRTRVLAGLVLLCLAVLPATRASSSAAQAAQSASASDNSILLLTAYNKPSGGDQTVTTMTRTVIVEPLSTVGKGAWVVVPHELPAEPAPAPAVPAAPAAGVPRVPGMPGVSAAVPGVPAPAGPQSSDDDDEPGVPGVPAAVPGVPGVPAPAGPQSSDDDDEEADEPWPLDPGARPSAAPAVVTGPRPGRPPSWWPTTSQPTDSASPAPARAWPGGAAPPPQQVPRPGGWWQLWPSIVVAPRAPASSPRPGEAPGAWEPWDDDGEVYDADVGSPPADVDSPPAGDEEEPDDEWDAPGPAPWKPGVVVPRPTPFSSSPKPGGGSSSGGSDSSGSSGSGGSGDSDEPFGPTTGPGFKPSPSPRRLGAAPSPRPGLPTTGSRPGTPPGTSLPVGQLGPSDDEADLPPVDDEEPLPGPPKGPPAAAGASPKPGGGAAATGSGGPGGLPRPGPGGPPGAGPSADDEGQPAPDGGDDEEPLPGLPKGPPAAAGASPKPGDGAAATGSPAKPGAPLGPKPGGGPGSLPRPRPGGPPGTRPAAAAGASPKPGGPKAAGSSPAPGGGARGASPKPGGGAAATGSPAKPGGPLGLKPGGGPDGLPRPRPGGPPGTRPAAAAGASPKPGGSKAAGSSPAPGGGVRGASPKPLSPLGSGSALANVSASPAAAATAAANKPAGAGKEPEPGAEEQPGPSDEEPGPGPGPGPGAGPGNTTAGRPGLMGPGLMGPGGLGRPGGGVGGLALPTSGPLKPGEPAPFGPASVLPQPGPGAKPSSTAAPPRFGPGVSAGVSNVTSPDASTGGDEAADGADGADGAGPTNATDTTAASSEEIDIVIVDATPGAGMPGGPDGGPDDGPDGGPDDGPDGGPDNGPDGGPDGGPGKPEQPLLPAEPGGNATAGAGPTPPQQQPRDKLGNEAANASTAGQPPGGAAGQLLKPALSTKATMVSAPDGESNASSLAGPPSYVWRQPGAAKTMLIGCALPFSGDKKNDGLAIYEALKMAMDDYLPKLKFGFSVNLTCLNSQCADIPAYNAVKQLGKDRAVAMVGELCSAASVAAAGVANELKIPLISPASTSPQLTSVDYFFRTVPTDRYQGAALAEYALKHGYKNLGIIYEDASYGFGLAFNVIATFTRDGGSVPVVYAFKKGQPDVAAAVAKMQEGKANTERPINAVFVATNNLTFVKDFLVAAKAANLGLPVLGGDSLADPTLFEYVKSQAGDPSLLSNLVTIGFDPGDDTFVNNFKRRADASVAYSSLAARGYDAMAALLKALAAAPQPKEPTAIADQLPKQKFEGVSGPIAFDKSGDALPSNHTYVISKFDPTSGQLQALEHVPVV